MPKARKEKVVARMPKIVAVTEIVFGDQVGQVFAERSNDGWSMLGIFEGEVVDGRRKYVLPFVRPAEMQSEPLIQPAMALPGGPRLVQ